MRTSVLTSLVGLTLLAMTAHADYPITVRGGTEHSFKPDPDAQVVKDPDSYEVSAIYDNRTRHGIVLGSITHDLWKTGIEAKRVTVHLPGH